MEDNNISCFGKYDFNHIVKFAKKRFIDGCSTISLLKQARTEIEREEIALVCMLDIEDDIVVDLQLKCRYAEKCKVINCRDKIRRLLES